METNGQEISGLWSRPVRGVHPWYGGSPTNWALEYKGEVSYCSFSECPTPGVELKVFPLSCGICVWRMCVLVGAMSGQISTPDIYLTSNLSFGDRQGLLLNLELNDSARLAGQRAPGSSCLHLPSAGVMDKNHGLKLHVSSVLSPQQKEELDILKV